MTNNERLDDILDRALSDYSDAEPLAGLEQRVLNRVATVRSERPRSFVWRSAVLAALLVGLVVTAVTFRPKIGGSAKKTDIALLQGPATLYPGRAEPKLRHSSVAAKRRQPANRLPKRQLFPTPTPLTGEERALLAFASRHPNEAEKAFADLSARSSQPIVIPAIEIVPIQEGDK